MSSNTHFDEYHAALDKVIRYALAHEIQYSCNGRSETYYIGNKLIAKVIPPVSKPNIFWPWKVVPTAGQPIRYEALLDGKALDEKLPPQWIFHFLQEQHRFQVKRMAIVSDKTSVRASA
jgi:hypothetical protein